MQEKKILIQMRDLRVGSGIASCIMKYYEYTVEQGYTIDFLLNRNPLQFLPPPCEPLRN